MRRNKMLVNRVFNLKFVPHVWGADILGGVKGLRESLFAL